MAEAVEDRAARILAVALISELAVAIELEQAAAALLAPAKPDQPQEDSPKANRS